MGLVQVQEMLVLDDGFRVRFLLEKRLRPFHDHVRVIILFHAHVAGKQLFVGSAQRIIV